MTINNQLLADERVYQIKGSSKWSAEYQTETGWESANELSFNSREEAVNALIASRE